MNQKYLDEIFREMCKRVNVDFNSIDFSKDDWYRTKTWDEKEKNSFKLWLQEHLKDSKISRELYKLDYMSKNKREKASEWFLFNYGWTLKGSTNTLCSYKKKAWLYKFYETSKEAHKAKEIYPVIDNIKNLFAEKEYKIVNEILDEIQLEQLSPTAMVAFLSASFPARRKLSNWNSACNKIKDKLDEMGLDTRKVLVGFLD